MIFMKSDGYLLSLAAPTNDALRQVESNAVRLCSPRIYLSAPAHDYLCRGGKSIVHMMLFPLFGCNELP